MDKRCSHLLVVAHPDDEAIFFGGLLQTRKDWHVVCVSDGNAKGTGKERRGEFFRSCKTFGVKKPEMLGIPDRFNERFEMDSLIEAIGNLGRFKKVYTHGILGEYGHQHHTDVSFAVHKVFSEQSIPVYSLAYNTFPESRFDLTAAQFKTKADVVWKVYKKETRDLLHNCPVLSQEGYLRVPFKEIDALYQWLTSDKGLNTNVIKVHKWLIPYLKTFPPYYFMPYIGMK